MDSLFVDQIRLFLNETVRSPGTTASVSRILPPKFALIIMAYLRVFLSKPVPGKEIKHIIRHKTITRTQFNTTFDNTQYYG